MENARAVQHPDISQQVGLALRGHRRELGQSQRAYAETRGMSRSQLARMEHEAAGLKLGDVAEALDGTGYCLAVVPMGATPDVEWDPTDLEARTRDGRRFPANRTVRRSRFGPNWWMYHEVLGSRGCGPRPRWTAEGFTPDPGTRFGPKPLHGRGIPPS